jgi:hypothetical protein
MFLRPTAFTLAVPPIDRLYMHTRTHSHSHQIVQGPDIPCEQLHLHSHLRYHPQRMRQILTRICLTRGQGNRKDHDAMATENRE